VGERSAPAFPLTLSFANNTTDVGRVFILWFFMFLLKYKNMFLCFYVFNPKSVFYNYAQQTLTGLLGFSMLMIMNENGVPRCQGRPGVDGLKRL